MTELGGLFAGNAEAAFGSQGIDLLPTTPRRAMLRMTWDTAVSLGAAGQQPDWESATAKLSAIAGEPVQVLQAGGDPRFGFTLVIGRPGT